jgi:hypothetical protein
MWSWSLYLLLAAPPTRARWRPATQTACAARPIGRSGRTRGCDRHGRRCATGRSPRGRPLASGARSGRGRRAWRRRPRSRPAVHPPGPPATHAASFTARHSACVRFSGSQQRAQNANRRSQNWLTHRTTRQSVQSYAACVLQKGQTVHRAPVPSSGRTGGRAQTAMGRPSSSAWCRRSAALVSRSAATARRRPRGPAHPNHRSIDRCRGWPAIQQRRRSARPGCGRVLRLCGGRGCGDTAAAAAAGSAAWPRLREEAPVLMMPGTRGAAVQC